jgi:hypothetical protein
MKEFIHSKRKKIQELYFVSEMKLLKTSENFFRIKVYTLNFNYTKFVKVFEKAIPGVKISYCRCSKWNHKVFFFFKYLK